MYQKELGKMYSELFEFEDISVSRCIMDSRSALSIIHRETSKSGFSEFILSFLVGTRKEEYKRERCVLFPG